MGRFAPLGEGQEEQQEDEELGEHDEIRSEGPSCWGRLLSWRRKWRWWRRRRRRTAARWRKSFMRREISFNYDPLSYAKNFDDDALGDGHVDGEEEDRLHCGFSARFAVVRPPSAVMGQI
ncbi:hypothetical protein HPP92_026752 [Vanilla planifolia]|uniref:Uncharacterized protein n=1 Tax=Vanilla planifolia TaxID=51239 RepID=A0A835U5X7_VANPL|nr:hypothetical protein HPP92_026752 [Vanilla planifolia]